MRQLETTFNSSACDSLQQPATACNSLQQHATAQLATTCNSFVTACNIDSSVQQLEQLATTCKSSACNSLQQPATDCNSMQQLSLRQLSAAYNSSPHLYNSSQQLYNNFTTVHNNFTTVLQQLYNRFTTTLQQFYNSFTTACSYVTLRLNKREVNEKCLILSTFLTTNVKYQSKIIKHRVI